MTHTSQRRGLYPSCNCKELVIIAMIPKGQQKKRGINGAMSRLGRAILRARPDNWIFRDIIEITIPNFGVGQPLFRPDDRRQRITAELAGGNIL